MRTIAALPVLIPFDAVELAGELMLPESARGIVCVDVSTSQSDSSPESLYALGLGVLQIDLLTREEHADGRACNVCRNDVQLIAERLACATDWLAYARPTRDLPVGYWATGVGTAAALIAAARRPALVSAVVSNNGRPLLARAALPQVRAPTLLIAVASDDALVKVNCAALSQMFCEKRLELIAPSDSVACLAREWFECHFARGGDSPWT